MISKRILNIFPKKGFSLIGPLILFFLLAFILSFLWLHDREQKRQSLKELTGLMTEQTSFRLESWINQRFTIADYLALNWTEQYVQSSQKFKKDVANLLKIYSGIQAINWIDADWTIRIVNPLEGNEQALNKDLHFHPAQSVKTAIQKAIDSKKITCSPVVPLLQGGQGFASYRPLFQNEQIFGFINVVFKTDTLIKYCLGNPFLRQNFKVKITTLDGDSIFQSAPSLIVSEYYQESLVKIGDQYWKVTIDPTENFIKSQLDVTKDKYFILNLIFVLIISVLIWNVLLRHYKLQQSEQRFRSLFESANIWIHLLKTDGTILRANPIFFQQTKIRLDKLEGKNFTELLTAKSQRIFKQWLMHLTEQPEFRSELEFKIKGRKSGIIDCSGVVIENESGKSIVLYSNNVTDKKRFEKALNESEEKYRQIVEQSHDAIFIYRNNKFLFVNESLKTLSGYDKEELYKIDIFQLIHPDDRDKLVNFANARKKGSFSPHQYTTRIITKSGKLKICEFNVNTILYQGKTAVLGTVRDITKEREAHFALQESEKRYRNLFENVPVGLYRITQDGNIIAANPAMLKLLGYDSFDELNKINFFSLYTDKKTYTLWKNLLKFSEKQHTHETRLKRKDGNIIWVRDTAKIYRDAETNEVYFEGVLEDITEQKKAKDQLVESERRFKEMANLLPQCVFESDPKLRLTYVNSFATRLVGYSQHEMLNGMNILEWFPEGQKVKVEEFFNSILNFKQPPSNEFLALRKDGKLFPVLIFATAILRRDEVNGIRGVLVDISERKRIELALKESETRYRSLVEQSPDAIIVYENGSVLFANQAAAKIYHAKSINDLIGLPFLNFIHPDYRELVKERIIAAAKTGKNQPLVQEKHIALDGTEIDVEVVLTPLEYQGRIVNLIIIRDITDRLKYQHALQESEERFKSILTSMIDMVFLFDPNGKLLFFNTPNPQNLNLDFSRFIGKPIFRYLPRTLKLQLKATIKKLNEGQTVKLEFNQSLTNGQIKWFSANITPMLIDQKIHGYVAVVRDITNRKESELKLSQALSEKEILLQEVHHRVKNNLQSLFYLIQMNKNQVKDVDSKEIFNDLQNQLKAMSLVYEQLYHSTNLAAIDMKSYLQNLLTNVRHSFANIKDVNILIDVDDITLTVDKALPCGLIVNELVSNAFKYAFTNGDFTKKEIYIGFKEKQSNYQLTIWDTGIGFSVGNDLSSLNSMGLKLVHLWATHQLGGKINFNSGQGAEINIQFSKK
ncbi:MAG: PAS domain S-box protein [Caldisericaceae bacterium]|nr:PAS domain S-box protein [Caldisericaceae bacterium]